jgi:hypothetical protein
MPELFGEAAARLCGAASLLLGWRPDEFWRATPTELAMALTPPRESVEGVTIAELKQRFPGAF